MATLESPDSNILDAEAVNWRLVVYPAIAVLVLLIGGFGIYSYMQSQRQEHEANARQALLQAKTPASLLQVADQFPGTTHGAIALMAAANLSFDQKDYTSAGKDYQRVIDGSGIDAILRDSAQLGLASALEATGTPNNHAVDAFLAVADRGNKSPYAPYACLAAARLYEQQHDTDDERRVLTEAASLGGDSPFVKEAQLKLRSLDAAAPQTPLPR